MEASTWWNQGLQHLKGGEDAEDPMEYVDGDCLRHTRSQIRISDFSVLDLEGKSRREEIRVEGSCPGQEEQLLMEKGRSL